MVGKFHFMSSLQNFITLMKVLLWMYLEEWG